MRPLFLSIALLILATAFFSGTTTARRTERVLVFSKTKGYRHNNISAGLKAISEMGAKHHFLVDSSEDVSVFTEENLRRYETVIFLNPTGDSVLNEDQQKAFQQYIRNGGGFVGIHAATDFLYSWPWYGKMVGGYFASHPKVQEAELTVIDASHLSTRDLPSPWKHKDEWYNFKSFNTEVNVLMKADEKTYEGGKMGDFHPVSWYHAYDGGRAFYTGLGHTKECFTSDTVFLKHLWGGIAYALGRKSVK